MASRYGSLKQLDSFGPHGETIIDYSIYDALRAGFGKIVFVVRESISEEFKAVMQGRLPAQPEVDYVLQELDMLPPGFAIPAGRTKPWGTGQAVWLAAAKIREPFAVINGDDFYGYESFKLVADFLQNNTDEATYGLIGFRLQNTLSEHGAVSRGLCELDGNGYLRSLTELTKIVATADGIEVQDPATAIHQLQGDEIVSMNLMAFQPSVFPYFEQGFNDFLRSSGTALTSEFYLPGVVNAIVRSGAARVKVLQTPEKWFGVTYPGDKPTAIQNIAQLVSKGVYAEDLWKTSHPS
ncbi:nucleotidyltransferase family protein [Pontibacter sp. HJ8]